MNNSKKMNLEGFIINLVIMHGMINLHAWNQKWATLS